MSKLAEDYRIVAVKAYAKEHYEEGGWDVVLETMDDEAIYWVIYKARSSKGAIERMAKHVGVYDEVRLDIIAESGEPAKPTVDDLAALLKKNVKVRYSITYVGQTVPVVEEVEGKLVSFVTGTKRTRAKTKATGIELAQGMMNLPGFGASPVTTVVSLDKILSGVTV